MRVGIFVLVLALLPSFAAWGYDVIEVKDGGTLKGTVKVTGNVPKDETVAVTKDANYCGATLPREKYVIGPGGGVKNVVVLIENISRGKAIPDKVVEIDNKKCAFHPHVQVGAKGQKVGIINSDPMLHNTHIYLDKNTVFNVALPLTGFEVKKTIKESGLMTVRCDVHSFMLGYLYIADSPYITVTDEKGDYSLTDIPAGQYEVKFWHEGFGELEKGAEIAPGGVDTLNVQYEAK
jgi:plastocyanin